MNVDVGIYTYCDVVYSNKKALLYPIFEKVNVGLDFSQEKYSYQH